MIGDNTDATDSETIFTFIDEPSCGSYLGGDVWYAVTIPGTGTVTLETQEETGSNLNDTAIAVYDEDGNQIACNDDETPGSNFFSQIELTGQTPGELLFIRVWAFENAQAGAFRIAAYNPTLGIADKAKIELDYYPNPVIDRVTFTVSEEIKNIEIYNLLGGKVVSKAINNSTGQVDLSNLATGTYVARVQTERGSQAVKLIKQ